MAQQLIVEGNDAIVLANILMKRGLNPPKGYSNPSKFTNKFVKQAGSISQVELTLENALNQPDLTNIGIIVDADQVGAVARKEALIEKIAIILNQPIPAELTFDAYGCLWQVADTLKVGVWVMPNNQENGYLEHFLLELIDGENATFQFAQTKLEELMQEEFCEFTEIKKQKALLHTYLAWQKNPGLPMGTAVQANYLNARYSQADNFENWFKQVFELEN